MPLRKSRLIALTGLYGILLAGACSLSYRPSTNGPAPQAAASLEEQYQQQVKTVFGKYCLECHNKTDKVADLMLDTFADSGSIITHREKFDLISKYVRTQQMPPDGQPQPNETERAGLSKFIDGRLYAYYKEHPDPGKVTIRRLNKSEYNNTIRDLVGVDFQPADDFPQDDSGYGFDNIGDVLSLPPVLMEKYISAADRILDEALSTEPPVSKLRRITTSQAEIGFNARGDRGDGWAKLISLEEDDFATEQSFPAGDYIVRVKAFSEPVGGGVVGQGSDVPLVYEGEVPVTSLGLFVGDAFIKDLPIDAREAAPKVYEARVGLPGGKVRISASVRRNRGGLDNETYMLNGRIGSQQPGIVYVRYMEIEGPLPAAIERTVARKLATTGPGRVNPQGSWEMKENGEAAITVKLDKPGEVILRAQVASQQAGNEPAKMEFRANGKVLEAFTVMAPGTLQPLPRQRLFDINLLRARPYVYETKVSLPTGESRLSAAFINAFADPQATNINLRQRQLMIDYLEVVNPSAPLPAAPMPEPFAKFFVKAQGGRRAEARAMLSGFATRAFRRPVADGEVDRLMRLYDLAAGNGENHETSLKLALKAVLVSPHFLFLGDMAAVGAKPDTSRPVSEYQLASRLSYFLWSSTPDEELLALAGRNELRKNLPAQVKRMLASPKSASFVTNFAGQWLQLRNLPDLAPDKLMFADFDDGMRRDMTRETELLFDSILRENKSVLEFLTANYTFVNARLARFYGFTSVEGMEFQKVSLADTNRRGVLTHGSVLTLTSNPTRTSPVKRGKFVLETLLGTPPPPPPPDVPQLEDQKASSGSLRQQMEMHRENPMCASCHAQMDPIGFGLENFDAVGKWRDFDGPEPVDAGGILKTGETFGDARQLAAIIASKRQDDFITCLTEKMLTYALGRGVEPFDRPAVQDIVTATKSDGNRFDTLILGVVQSLPFQNERGDKP